MSQDILQTAHSRAEQLGLPYAGAVTPKEAFEVLQAMPDAVLVDVRSQAELDLVGRIPNAISIQWAFYPGMVPNPEFAEQLQAAVDKNAPVIFMCRTGGRSHGAASMAQQLGYHNAYNMLEGFEGEANELKQRTLINGWKHAGLIWTNG
ncbi:MAG TPA: rhodanese-like domain-containing protein [Methylophilus sp.]|jgi:rhodanese-related sulfurtransferase|nr:rhodanese-like domain-containing protein [Methylophilus sp.]HQQ34158.1 rhodanese-like domain-containing protein [Methylophilus sp.]